MELTDKKIEKVIKEELAEFAEMKIHQVKGTEILKDDLGIDSLDILNILFAINKKLNVKVDPQNIGARVTELELKNDNIAVNDLVEIYTKELNSLKQ